jgi:hypothetical protein
MGSTLSKAGSHDIHIESVVKPSHQPIETGLQSNILTTSSTIPGAETVPVTTTTEEESSDETSDSDHQTGSSKPASTSPVTTNSTDGIQEMDQFISKLIDTVKPQPLLPQSFSAINSSLGKNRSFILRNSDVMLICQLARIALLSQPTLLEIQAPVKVVGDVLYIYVFR